MTSALLAAVAAIRYVDFPATDARSAGRGSDSRKCGIALRYIPKDTNYDAAEV